MLLLLESLYKTRLARPIAARKIPFMWLSKIAGRFSKLVSGHGTLPPCENYILTNAAYIDRIQDRQVAEPEVELDGQKWSLEA